MSNERRPEDAQEEDYVPVEGFGAVKPPGEVAGVDTDGLGEQPGPAPQVGAVHVSLLRYLEGFEGTKTPAERGRTIKALRKQAEAAAKKAARTSRADRWADACGTAREGLEELAGLKEEYEEWRDNLPENLRQSPVGEKLEAVCDLDLDSATTVLDEAENMELPMGFGRD